MQGLGRCEPGTNSCNTVGPAGARRGEAELPRGARGVAAASRSPGPDVCPWRPGAAERRERAGELGVHPQGHGGLGAHPSDGRREEESGARSSQKGPRKGS